MMWDSWLTRDATRRNSTLKRKCQQMELAQQRCGGLARTPGTRCRVAHARLCRAAAEDDSSVSSLVSDETGDTPKSVLAEPKKRGAASAAVSVRSHLFERNLCAS